MSVKIRIDYECGRLQNRKKACWRGRIKNDDKNYMEREIVKIWVALQKKHSNDGVLLKFTDIELYD